MTPAGAARVRPAAVAGAFYPGTRPALAEELRRSFAGAATLAPGDRPKALIVPHAGYVYSGPVAATAYQTLVLSRDVITRVVLFGPSHRVPLDGMAVSSADWFETPLGRVAVDQDARRQLLAREAVSVDDDAHAWEHSLEVQLPFLQSVLDDFTLVPLVAGRCEAKQVSDVLQMLWHWPETLIVVSTDLSHYHPYEVAVGLDARCAQAVVELRADEIGDRDACGAHPLRGVLLAAAQLGWRASLLDLRNSGDTAGDRDRVVGYGAFRLD